MLVDPAQVTGIMRDVAREAVMPRFRSLGAGDIREKGPGDLVTVADEDAERLLSVRLPPLLAGSRVVGEEGAAADPDTLAVLADDMPVWIVDPVDGTQNFADGVACFGLIVALCRAGEILAGWIHDPINDRTFHAVTGQGAWEGTRRLRLDPAPAMGGMTGYLGPRFRRRFGDWRDGGRSDVPKPENRLKCVAREYMELAEGRRNFARYGGRLKPWDHAAGVLILREAGGIARSPDDGVDYRATAPREASLLLAPTEDHWRTLRDLMIE